MARRRRRRVWPSLAALFLSCSSTPSSVFIIDTDPIIPAALTSLTRLLLLTQEEWEKTREKGRPPKSKFDLQVSPLLRRIIETRLTGYQSPDLEVCSSNHRSTRGSVTWTWYYFRLTQSSLHPNRSRSTRDTPS